MPAGLMLGYMDSPGPQIRPCLEALMLRSSNLTQKIKEVQIELEKRLEQKAISLQLG